MDDDADTRDRSRTLQASPVSVLLCEEADHHTRQQAELDMHVCGTAAHKAAL